MTVRRQRFLALAVGLGLALASVGATTASSGSVPGREIYMPTRGMVEKAGHGRPTRSNNLSYGGGVSIGGVNTGVVTGTAKVYLVLWGSQWSSDPSGESALLQNFFGHVGGSSWNNSVTQYCQGVSAGTVFCNGAGTAAANGNVWATTQVWADNGSAAPASPTQSQLAAEAVAAAGHFGNGTAASNTHVQYVIATAHNNNSSGFGTQYCAWHSSASYAGGYLGYTNLPYITDAGASCGANFNGLGTNAGITIVEGHEFAETESDIYPNVGWLDRGGAENGDKCAWISSGQGASANVTLGGANSTFPVQSLWSNAFNSGAGGCVLSY
jgi:serine protease